MVYPGPEAQVTAGPSYICNIELISERELFAILCHRPSVCMSVSRLSVTFVHPTQAIKIFGNVSTPFGTTAIC